MRILNKAMRVSICKAALLLLAALFVPLGTGFGQTATPTSDQLDVFRNLPADQQQALMKQIGGALSGSGTSGLGNLSLPSTRGQNRDRAGSEDNADQNDNNMRDQSDSAQSASSIPMLRPQDTIIIEIDFHLPPRPMSSYAPPVVTGNSTAAQALAQGVNPGALNNPPQVQAQQQQQSQGSSEADLTPTERQHLTELMTLIRNGNPYKLSRDGVLFLPGFAGIPLSGLIEDLASLRLKSEPALAKLDVRVTKLPLDKSGPEALKPFGYDLFQRAPSTFAPVTNVPVPADYIVGAGDQFEVQLYGSQNRTFTVPVGRDGRINLPEIGPISVAGERFTDVKANVEARVARQMIGVRASLSMSDTRAIRVFVLGEANRPGSYTISGLGTITSALFAAGGVRPIGSLRNIQLKRQGETVRRLDLYDLLIRGDTRDDTKLLPGDVIFIPAVGPTVSVEGEVRRPAIYETRGETSLAELVELAGGLNPEADSSKMMLTRINEQQRRIVLRVDPTTPDGKSMTVRNGDSLRVTRLRPTIDSGVTLSGYAYTTGAVAYHDGMRLTDLIHSVDELQPDADLHYLLIRRELPPNRRIAVLSADLAAALKAPGAAADVKLFPRDQVMVFDLKSGRDRVIQPVLEELRLQSTLATPSDVV